ncbi:Aste57867_9574 [Aphanomyces stellatus]|uniref:Aste57867_9574 protein n=1 Tax=Aphanomyces stellatus TaxID=120398 RepID=A0A485KN77_9STRA|nr:hypothetical protein As57867_009536 [Aphanomyces stellatus]VFT86453.1 Aste57867_9574 [Aphanomyces stellatus]
MDTSTGAAANPPSRKAAPHRSSLMDAITSPLRRTSTRMGTIERYNVTNTAVSKIEASMHKTSRAILHQIMMRRRRSALHFEESNRELITRKLTAAHSNIGPLPKRAPRLTSPLHPNSSFRAIWDILLIALLFYTAIAPVQIAFVLDERLTDPGFVWDCFVDVLFATDLTLNFFTPYTDPTTNQLVDHPTLMMRHYFHGASVRLSGYAASRHVGWFGLDFISVFPYNLVAVAYTNSVSVAKDSLGLLKVDSPLFLSLSPSTKLLRVFRILKLARVFRASRILSRWNAVLGVPIALSQLGKYALFMVVLAHWMACLWATVPQYEADGVAWRNQYDNFDVNDLTSQYIAALYWSIMTIGTIGYGDVPIPTTTEKVVAILCMTIGCGAYSFIVGSVCGLVSSLDESSTEFNQQMDHLNVFMDREMIPRFLMFRMREYFLHSRDLVLHRYFSSVLGHLSPGLRGELSVYMSGEWIHQIYFLMGGPPGEHARFVTALCQKMDAELYPPDELIVRNGESTHKMYVLAKGLVARNGWVLQKGTFFGEDVILTHVDTRMVFDTRTLTYCETHTLHRQDIDDILATGSFPNKAKRIRRAAMFLAIARRMRSLYIQLQAIQAMGRFSAEDQRSWIRMRLLGDHAVGLHPNASLAAAVACAKKAVQSIDHATDADARVGMTDQVLVAASLLETATKLLNDTMHARRNIHDKWDDKETFRV